MPDLQYPVGRFEWTGAASPDERRRLIAQIAATPMVFRSAVAGLTPKQLDTPYRPGGWTVRQVVHHVPDSHMNAFIRFKLALTEDTPTIKPYDQDRWAVLADAQDTPVETSLALLDAIHERWVILLRSLRPEDFARVLIHPEHDAPMSLDKVLAQYAWHGAHHAAHIANLRERMGWKPGKARAKPKPARQKAKSVRRKAKARK